MKKEPGTPNRILVVDLGKQQIQVETVSSRTRALYLGGKGLGLKLLHDRIRPGTDPLGPDNIIAIMPGVLMGSGAPCSGRFEAITKSPLTRIMAASSCGGPFGMALKTAGWDGLLISGRAAQPLYLEITARGVTFRDAASLWGLTIPQTQAVLDSRKRKSLVIGPAGENQVWFANLASGHRFLGRGGIGAVMGAKNLKAVTAIGGAVVIKPRDPARFKKACKRAAQYVSQNHLTAHQYREYGTSANVMPCNTANILPVNNFQDGSHEQAERVSGETMAQAHDTRHHTCRPCIIQCGHQGIFGQEKMSAPEFETIGLLGTSLGIFDLETIARWNRLCGELGMDTISAGATLAWVMEAGEKKLLDTELRFGSPVGVAQALEDMAFKRGMGGKMARGVRSLSKQYGGEPFAIHVKGLEMAAYDPRGSYGQGLAYAVANRGGCHLSAYLVAQEVYFRLLKPDTTYGKARWVKFFEDLGCCINSLQICQFTMFAFLMEPPLSRFTPDLLLAGLMQYLPGLAISLIDISLYRDLWSAMTGIELSCQAFITAGERIHVLERFMNTQEGISVSDDILPPRMLTQARASDPEKRTVPLEKMRSQYYCQRQYDTHGIPRASLLQRLGIR